VQADSVVVSIENCDLSWCETRRIVPLFLSVYRKGAAVYSHQRRRRRSMGWIGCAPLFFYRRKGCGDGAGIGSRDGFVGVGGRNIPAGGWRGAADYFCFDQPAEQVSGDEAGGEPGGGPDPAAASAAGEEETRGEKRKGRKMGSMRIMGVMGILQGGFFLPLILKNPDSWNSSGLR
jgi:hypothetical protein